LKCPCLEFSIYMVLDQIWTALLPSRQSNTYSAPGITVPDARPKPSVARNDRCEQAVVAATHGSFDKK
jgi:hypothetical protein